MGIVGLFIAPPVIGLLVGTGVLVAALAIYLTTIVYILKDVNFTLGTVLIGVRAITNQVQPVGEVVNGIASNVTAINNALGNLLGDNTRLPATTVRQ
ncbi:MAG: hypothetical protein M3083_19675 [Actinomycetota bacterium]|nr:hypothetical protein [Actinomycetota bacterium]